MLEEFLLEDGRVASVVLGAKGGGLSGGALYEIGKAYAVGASSEADLVVFH